MDRQSQRMEANFHTWHMISSLPVSGCRQCKRQKEMNRRTPFARIDQSRIACGSPKYDSNDPHPRKDYYMDSNGELFWDPPSPMYSPEFND